MSTAGKQENKTFPHSHPEGRVRGHARSQLCIIAQSFCPLTMLATLGQSLSHGAHHEGPALTLGILAKVSFLDGISCF